jgi:hypothetical protein
MAKISMIDLDVLEDMLLKLFYRQKAAYLMGGPGRVATGVFVATIQALIDLKRLQEGGGRSKGKT